MRISWMGLAAILAAGVLGCEDDPDPVPLEEYCDQWAEILCGAYVRCNCVPVVPSETCLAYAVGECGGSFADELQGVEDGSLAYDADAAGECFAGVRSATSSCTVDWDEFFLPACDAIFLGRVPENGACHGDAWCLAGLECWNDVCRRMPTNGQACLEDDGCADDHECIDGTCLAERGRGGSCAESSSLCAAELFCDDRTETCQPYLGSGEDCSFAGWACGDDLFCESATERCRPYLHAGESCAAEAWACGDDLYCDETTTLCTAYPGLGGDCAASDGDCAEGYFCDEGDICRAQLGDGTACTDDEQCRSDNCSGGVCAPPSSDICSLA